MSAAATPVDDVAESLALFRAAGIGRFAAGSPPQAPKQAATPTRATNATDDTLALIRAAGIGRFGPA